MRNKIRYILIILFFVGCNLKSDASGIFNNLFIVSSPEDREYIRPIIEGVFSKSIHTPTEEFEINLIWKNAWELDEVQSKYNVLVVGIDNPKDSTGDYLCEKFLPKNNPSVELFSLNNVYSNNQQILVIHALDAVHFSNIVKNNKSWLLNLINESIDFNLSEHIFSKGFNLKLSENIHDKFGVNLKTQEDFTIINEFDDEFLWIGRGYPYRWITFHKTKNILFESPELSWVNLDSLFKGTIPDIVIGEWYKTSEFKEINGNKIRILRGLYEHKTSESGGPFFVYMFELHESNEVILISGFVNYPGHDKYLLLRQLEIIVKTALN